MKSKAYLLFMLVCLMQGASCKKDSPQQLAVKQITTLEGGLTSFSINGEILAAIIDTSNNTVLVAVPNSFNKHSLTVNYSLASQVSATINNSLVSSGSTFDFSAPVTLTVVSADKKRTTSFQVNVQTEIEYDGLVGTITDQKSLNKSYSFYYDQWDGSTYQAINCGPTVTTMAIKWADSTFTGKPADARLQIPASGGWWYTTNVQDYLTGNGINSKIDTLSNIKTLVKKNIDNNNLMILCLDMFGVPYNQIAHQHTQKFYETLNSNWGHFLLVKGYKVVGSTFYLEIYDPYAHGETYFNGQLKGVDRYYDSSSINFAAGSWWPYTIVVAAKGLQPVAVTSKFKFNIVQKAIPAARGK